MVFLDLGLPSPKADRSFDGLAVLRWLRKSPMTRGIPVAVVTAWSQEEAKPLTREIGAEAFLQKPVKPDDLRSTARILMDDL